MSITSKISEIFTAIYILCWDWLLLWFNIFTFDLKVGHVVPAGHPGAGGKWPEFKRPVDGDSRCSCPALNALSNHGILPRDGKNITFPQMTAAVRATYNFAPSFCRIVPGTSAVYLHRKFSKDTFNLAELDLHNLGIEHDASLVRQDAHFMKDQGKPDEKLIRDLLASASGTDSEGYEILTQEDLAGLLSKRRVVSQRSNPEYKLDQAHKMVSSSNGSTLLLIFGGRTDDLRPFLIDERIPEGWEPRLRARMGLTIAAFNKTVIPVEHKVDEEKARKALDMHVSTSPQLPNLSEKALEANLSV